MKNRQPPKRSKAWREHRHDKSEETDIDELNLEILGLWRCPSCEVMQPLAHYECQNCGFMR